MGTVHLFSQVASLIGRTLVNFAAKKSDILTSIAKLSQGIRGGLNHLGIQKTPSRNALSHQNAKRDAMVFRDIYRLLHKRLGTADLHMSIPGGYQGITHHVA